MNNLPTAILINAIEGVLAIAMLVFTDPRRTVSTTVGAHDVEGFAGDGGHGGSVPHGVSAREETTQDRLLIPGR